ncbi:hypothetical protein I2483_00890 [Sporosarcina sp. E16_3]|uniref:hypothetical protein n=1 Tax=Sporosarcina sp. E16_3 TaxID=2789293 RepID=UPI001A927A41|nr:hypothetical protein [Sporosarcina sp. E16_3]MBO0600205.1 hypothetical protein [Sporosarcina sp. E16_3]
MIVNNSYFKEELKVTNQLVEKYGREITDQSLHQFEKDFQVDLVKLEKITGQEFISVYDFLDGLNYEDRELYKDSDWRFIEQLKLKEMYLGMASDIDGNYARIDLKKVAEATITETGLSGNAAKAYFVYIFSIYIRPR